MPHIRYEVMMLLANTNTQLADAERKLARGVGTERVAAAGQVAVLKRQRELLRRRLDEIDIDPAASETIFQWLKEEMFNLRLHIQGGAAHR